MNKKKITLAEARELVLKQADDREAERMRAVEEEAKREAQFWDWLDDDSESHLWND